MTLITCPECGHSLSDEAVSCPSCGKPMRAPPVYAARHAGMEYRSEKTLFGLPLIHVATGIDPKTGRKRVAKGIIALGDIAIGVLAFGGIALGGVAFGGCSVGLVALGGLAVAGWVAVGGASFSLGLAIGGLAVGWVAIGGCAVGNYALGGGAFGPHPLGANQQSSEAIDYFSSWLGDWVRRFRR